MKLAMKNVHVLSRMPADQDTFCEPHLTTHYYKTQMLVWFILPMNDSEDEILVEGHLSVDTGEVFARAALAERDYTWAHQHIITLTIKQLLVY